MASAYKDKISKLRTELKKCEDTLATSEESSMSTMMICALVVPIVIFLGFYFGQPSWVQKKEGGKSVRDIKKVLMWTAGLTVAILGGMYIYNRYASGGGAATA